MRISQPSLAKIALFLVCGGPASAWAQGARGALPAADAAGGQPSAGPQSWRLTEVVKATLSTNPIMDASREKLVQAEAQRAAAGAALFPTLEATVGAATKQDALTGTANFGGDPYNAYSVGVELTQPLYAGGALAAGRRLYRKGVEQSKLDVQLTERDLTLRALTVFYDVLLAERKMSTQQRLQNIQQELLSTAQARYRIGNEQALTVLQIKTNLSLLEPQVTAAQNQLRVSAAELASLTGKPAVSSLKILGTLEAPEWEDVVRRVPKADYERAELARTLAQEEIAEANRDIVGAKHLPQLAGVAAWGRNGTQKSDLFDDDATAWSLGLQLSVPIFSGLSSFHDRAAAASQVAQARIAERQQRDQFALEQVRAEQELANAKSQVESATRALSQAREAVEVATRTYRLGTATYTQVSDAQTNLTNAEIGFEQAQFDLITKMANYFTAYGWPMPPLIEALESKWASVANTSAAANTNKGPAPKKDAGKKSR